MIYTDMTKRALKLCFEAHREQTPNGFPSSDTFTRQPRTANAIAVRGALFLSVLRV